MPGDESEDSHEPTAGDGSKTPGTRRRFLRLAGTGVLVGATGCSGGQRDAGSEPDGRETEPTTTASPTRTTRGQTETATQTATGEQITIGVLAPPPDDSPLGAALERTATLFADRINQAGGLFDAEFNVVVRPTTGHEARLNFQYLVRRDSADVVVGLGDNTAGLSAIGEVADNPVPLLCTGAPSTQINALLNDDYEAYKSWFRLHPNAAQLGRALAAFAAAEFDAIGWRDIAVVTEETRYLRAASRAFRAHRPAFTSLAVEREVSAETTDFTPVFADAAAQDIDGLVAFTSGAGGSLGSQWAAQQPDFGLGGWAVSAGLSPQGTAASHLPRYAWSVRPGAGPQAAPTQVTRQFIDDFRAAHGAPPQHSQAYLAHDALVAWKAAVEAAGTVERGAVVSALSGVSVTGATGTIEFYPKGHEWVHDPRFGADGIIPSVIQTQRVNGTLQHTGLWPDGSRSGEYHPPPWIGTE